MASRELISPDTRFADLGPLTLDSGVALEAVRVAYRTWGELAAAGDNAVLVCHALTGSADVDRWWPALLGPALALDPSTDLVIASNVLGSCYGTTGPTSPGPAGNQWGPDFPAVNVRDMVRLQRRLAEHLGVRRFRLVVGGSLGGMQALEWVVGQGDMVAAAVVLATSAAHSPWCIALSAAQRAAIAADHRFAGGRYAEAAPPEAGLAAARMMAMCTYRSPRSFAQRFGRRLADGGGFASEDFLRHHGKALVARFDANSYMTLTRAMDGHDVGRGRGGARRALAAVTQPVLVVSIASDVLYPPAEQRQLAARLGNGRWATIDSPHGHDGFLIEAAAVERLVRSFRAEVDGRAASRLAS